MTIRPSPEPKSSNVPDRPFKALKIFTNWSFVAGIYGKQNFLSAGLTKGAHITVKPTATPPKIPKL